MTDAAPHAPGTTGEYVRIWLILLGLLGAGVLCASFGIPLLANVLVFATAIVKAAIVLRQYMHLRTEPRFVTLILLGALSCVLILFLLCVPDMVLRDGWSRP